MAFMILTTIKLRTKLLSSFLFIGLLSIAVTGWQAYQIGKTALEENSFNRLTSIRETKKQQIEFYFQQIRRQIVAFSEDPMIIEAAKQFIAAFHEIHPNHYADTVHPYKNTIAGDPVQGPAGTIYDRIHEIYHPVFRTYLQRFGYYDIFIVSCVEGDIVYTVLKESDYATNLERGFLKNSNIAHVYMQVKKSADKHVVQLVDFASYAPSRNKPASFIAVPIFEAGKKIAVLIFQISIDEINRVMTNDKNWERDGLGKSGETYIVGADYKMRNDSRFFIEQPSTFFSMMEKVGTSNALLDTIRSQSTSILLQEVHTDASTEALAGRTNTKIISDYRGVTVLSSYTPLHIGGVDWIIISEIDASEVFQSVYALRERLILFSLFIGLFAIAFGVYISNTIATPILRLAGSTERFGKGELTHRAEVQTTDEIGLLAKTFNTMASNIMEKTTLFEQEVDQRERVMLQLQSSERELRSLSSHLQTIREEERKQIAREIHDELGQALTTLKLKLSLLDQGSEAFDHASRQRLNSMSEIIDETIKSVRRIITELRPGLLDDLGLTAAMEWQAEEFEQRTGIVCNLIITPSEIIVDQNRSTAIFRIFQEALTNTARHAHASCIDARLAERDRTIELSVTDNGKGITEEQISDSNSFGLIGIRERVLFLGGKVQIHGKYGIGTTVHVTVPKLQEDENR